MEEKHLEELSKACPRCGGKSANPSNKAGRCRSCLNKLAANKKKPGHWQRAQTKFDDAKRRENGKNGTASKKSKGRVKSRKQFVERFKGDEKKTGQKLSPDRKSNDRGYESSNVRNVPEKLNVGRHKVDPKKLANWRSKLKKNSELTIEDLKEMMLIKAQNNGDQNLIKIVQDIPEEMIFSLIMYGEIGE